MAADVEGRAVRVQENSRPAHVLIVLQVTAG